MSQEVTTVWRQACAELELQLSPAAYGTWIMSNPLTHLEPQPDGSIQAIFTSPTAFHATNLQKNFHELLQSVLEKIIGSPIQLDFQVGATPVAPIAPPRTPARPTQQMSAPHTGPQIIQPTSSVPAMPTETPSSVIGQKYTQFQPQTTVSPRVEDLFSPQTIQANTMNQAEHSARKAGLRPDYTFTTFAVSTTNEMAHAAATAVSNSPGQAYNPLFLYGGVGVGKTHLMHAIGNNILYKNPLANVLYLTGEEFTNQIVAAIQTKRAIEFKSKYRLADVLLIDDIQFIAGKTAVQEEFFHTFNAIIKQHSQIVLTSDRPPHEINLIEDRLRSRFEAGLMIDIQQPTFELRTAILLIKAKANRLEIPMDIAQNIASQVDSARRIEGVITKLRSEVELKGRAITMELVAELLKGEQPSSHEKLRVAPVDVLRAVANHYHIKQVALKGQRRVKSIVTARHIAMYLLKHELEMPYTEIGRWFANRDHTSAMHAVGKVEKLLTTDQQTRQDVSALRMNLLALAK
jgi:chromosomal replication initiator protein